MLPCRGLLPRGRLCLLHGWLQQRCLAGAQHHSTFPGYRVVALAKRGAGAAESAAAQGSSGYSSSSSSSSSSSGGGGKRLARAVRAVPIKVVTVSKGSSSAAEAMADEWQAKVARYTQASHVRIRPNPKKAASVDVAMKYEGTRVLEALAPGDLLVALDERGKDLTSEGFADLIADASDTGVASLVFAIGGPHGHPPEVRERANKVVRLSRCVLNHQVARIVLLEQLYRGWTILRGEPYHH